MNIKQDLILDFEKNRVKKDQTVKINDVNFNWIFESIFEIISKPKFIKYLNIKYKENFTIETLDFFNLNIDFLRSFIKEIDETFWNYLCETNDANLVVSVYEEFLQFIYSSTKEYINEFLIISLICFNENMNFEINTKKYEIYKYFDFKKENFKFNFQKFIYKRLKLINSQYSNNQVLNIIEKAYRQDIPNKERNILDLKRKAEII